MEVDATEFALTNWKYGTIVAERMCASILEVAGFRDVRPQNLLGGPDRRRM